MRFSLWSALACGALVLSTGADALAFDGQLALGGGLGVAGYDRAAAVGPLGSLYGAYGLSDSFDARLELSSAWLRPDAVDEKALLGSALGYLTYKLDVIQWIPWGGLGAGVHYLGGKLPGDDRHAVEPGLAAVLGFDYAWSRSDGLSFMAGVHVLPLAGEGFFEPSYVTLALRYEHRWGW